MFNPFKKLHHSRNLIYANHEKNIIISEELNRVSSLVKEFMVLNNLFEDKLYKALYKEYRKYHTVYDLYPLLLYFRIPILVQEEYVRKNIIIPENILMSVTHIHNSIPGSFRIPQHERDLILECLDKVTPYMAKNVIDEDFVRYIEFKFLSEWPFYLKNPDKYKAWFLGYIFNKLIEAGGDNKINIANIINRTIESKLKEAANN